MRTDNTEYFVNVVRHIMHDLKIRLSLPLTDSPSTLNYAYGVLVKDYIRKWSPETKGRIISYALYKGQTDERCNPPRRTPRYVIDPAFTHSGKGIDMYCDGDDLLNHLAVTTILAMAWDILVYDDQELQKKARAAA